MSASIDAFIQEVLARIVAEDRMKERIGRDLRTHIEEACHEEEEGSVLARMGKPEEVAKEFMDSIYEDKSEVIEQLIGERMRNKDLLCAYREYKSKTTVYGLPLIHIKFRRYYGFHGLYPIARMGVAKGIIAVGDISIGVVSLGAVALGGICLGGIGAGVLSLGALALGMLALGGVAVGGLALGGFAVGLGAFGGLAIGKIAIGGFAKGTVAIGGKAIGRYIISGHGTDLSSVGHVPRAQVYDLIRSAYPNLARWIVELFAKFVL